MGRALRICLVGATAAVGASGVAAQAAEAPRASLDTPICAQASDALNRLVAITAVMRPLTGTRRMQLQFNLMKKPRGARTYSVVRGGDLGKWVSPPDPTLGQRPTDVWKRQKQVVNLAAPVIYRYHVGFWWTGKHGLTLGRRFVWAAPCDER
jgi:hypothetical protein